MDGGRRVAPADENDALVARAYGAHASDIDALTRLEWLAASTNFARTSSGTRAAGRGERFGRAVREATSRHRPAPLSLRDHALQQLLFLDEEAVALAARATEAALTQQGDGAGEAAAAALLATLAFDRRALVAGDWAAIKHPDVVVRARELLSA